MSVTTAQENRLRKFAGFFKGYMGIMPLVTAGLAPLLTMMKAIPVFESQKSTLATYSGLLGFLLLAWVFYARRAFAVAMVHSATIPFGEAGFGVQALKRISANVLPLV